MKVENTFAPIRIENAEQYARIFTVTVNTVSREYDSGTAHDVDRVPGASLLAICGGVIERRIEGRWDNSGKYTEPATEHLPAITMIFGVKRDQAMEDIVLENASLRKAATELRDDINAQEKSFVAASKERDEQKKRADLLSEQFNAQVNQLQVAATRYRRLEDDLAKIKRAIGELAYNKALEAP